MKKPKKINKLRLKVLKGELNTHGQTAEYRDLMTQREGKYVEITPYDPYSKSIRRFFEGAVVDYFQLQHFQYSTKENKYVRVPRGYVRKMLKREFNGEYIPTLEGKFVREGKSTKDLGKDQFDAFIKRITHYMEANGMMLPYSDDYNAWIETSPTLKEVYPPLKELLEWSENKLKELNANYG